jgi:hyperosmotically inducible periplasmic protein
MTAVGSLRRPLRAIAFGSALAALAMAGCATSSPAPLSTDARIATELAARLAAAPELHPYDLRMDVTEGVVTLGGTVGDEATRRHAEELARRIDGVTEVVNEIELPPAEAATALDDPGITARVRAKLAADPDLDPLRIAVHTQAGTVTLAGVVATLEERQRAERAARETSGVRGVRNLLEVGAPADG